MLLSSCLQSRHVPILRLEVRRYAGIHTIYQIHAKPKLGIKRFASTLKSFDIEFQPFIEEINAKEGIIRELADAATMERIKSMLLYKV